ncbi:MAG: hypothetical protein RL226_742 [Bacteroidota bacterium]
MGSRLLYYLILKPLSLLPYFVLYRISDLLAFCFIYLFKYRKKVILDNLVKVFPDKNERWRAVVMKRFYRHLADVIVESIKNFSITAEEANQRLVPEGLEVLEKLHKEKRPVVMCGGHYNNWELFAVAAAGHIPHLTMAIYKRIQNRWLDQTMRETRGAFGLILVPTREATEWIDQNIQRSPLVVYAVDQSPADPNKCYWGPFLGLDTAMYLGAERHAKKYNMAVVYGHIEKRKRGYYAMRYELVTENPSSFADGELTQKLNDILAHDILQKPEYWLWSHKRWKHRRPEGWKLNAFRS